MGNHDSQVHSDPKVDIQKRQRLKDQCNYNHLPSQGTDVGLMKQKAADAKKLKENANLISSLRPFRDYSVFQRSVTMNKVTSPGFMFKRMQWNYGVSITPGHYCTPQTKGLSTYSQLPWFKQPLTKRQWNLNSYCWFVGRSIFCKVPMLKMIPSYSVGQLPIHI